MKKLYITVTLVINIFC